MSSPPSRQPTGRQLTQPPPIAQRPPQEVAVLNRPVNMLQQPLLPNRNLPIGLFVNLQPLNPLMGLANNRNPVVTPENRRPQPNHNALFEGRQGEITPSPAPTQAQTQIPPQLQRPQAPAPAQPNTGINLMDAFDDDAMEGGRIMKRNAQMSFYKVR